MYVLPIIRYLKKSSDFFDEKKANFFGIFSYYLSIGMLYYDGIVPLSSNLFNVSSSSILPSRASNAWVGHVSVDIAA